MIREPERFDRVQDDDYHDGDGDGWRLATAPRLGYVTGRERE
jgi:hypothetical protein